MNSTTPDWDLRYRENNTPWDRGVVSPALLRWLDRGMLAPPARVLVPGCGCGHEVVELARRGFSVTALDLAPTALAVLRTRLHEANLTATVIETDVFHWEAPRSFDAVFEQTCLCALEPKAWADYARRLHRWLRPQGRLFALFMQTGRDDGPPFHCALPEMHALFPADRWHWPAEADATVPHRSGLYELAFALARI